MKLSKKSCSADLIPTKILLQYIDVIVILPVFTSMINVSLSTDQFSKEWKVAVSPLLKKPGLDVEFSNLDPNLQYISKVQPHNRFDSFLTVIHSFHPISLHIDSFTEQKRHYSGSRVIF